MRRLYYLHLVPKSCTNLHEMLLEATTRYCDVSSQATDSTNQCQVRHCPSWQRLIQVLF